MAKLTWDERITRAEKRGRFTEDDRWCAANFSTCAVGENADSYRPRWSGSSVPLDLKLFEYGYDFDEAVRIDNIPKARKLYGRIQKRVATLPKKYRREATG